MIAELVRHTLLLLLLELVPSTGTKYLYQVLVPSTGTKYWYKILVPRTGTKYWYQVLVPSAGTKYWYLLLEYSVTGTVVPVLALVLYLQ
jgi:hypothetical protein